MTADSAPCPTAQPEPPLTRGYVTIRGADGERAVHYRRCGSGPAVVMLHDSPRSSRLHVPAMRALADRFTIFALDTPGYGNSDPLDHPKPTIEHFAVAVADALAALGLDKVPLYATHTSAKIALALVDHGGRPDRLLLDGLSIPDSLPDEAFITNYMRPFAPDPAGAYLGAEWSRVRDMLRWFPWFASSPDQRIAMDAPDAAWMADYGIDLFSAGSHYSDAYAAAMRYDPAPALGRCAVPTTVAARTDDVLHGYLARTAACGNPLVTTNSIPADRALWLEWLAQALAGGPDAAPAAPAARPTRSYIDTAHGQLHVSRTGRADGLPWLILSAPTTLHAQAWAKALGQYAPAIVPDLPGYGESDPITGAPALNAEQRAEEIADNLAAALNRLDCTKVTVLGIGLGAPLAAMLARRHPEHVARLVVDGVPPLTSPAATSFAAGLCPPIAFDAMAGSHLHRIWHILRDGEAQWPWHDQSQAAIRHLPPLFTADGLHQALTGVLKQPERWGDAALAALAINPSVWAGLTLPVVAFTHSDPAYASATALSDLCHATCLARPDDLSDAATMLMAMADQTPELA